MSVGIGASGIAGLALETTSGTYLAPTKFFPFDSESVSYQQDTVWRRPIRQSADVLGAVPGNVHVEGDVTFDCTEDVFVYFMYALRGTVVKSGTTPNFIYTATSNANALPTKTMSLTLVKNGAVFGYTGISVSTLSTTVDNGIFKCTAALVGQDEAVQSAPSPTWPTSVPFGAGKYKVEIPTATQVFDCDNFTWSAECNASPEYRLKDTSRGAQFIKFGEGNTTATMERDFLDRTEYDAYKALTSQSITFTATNGTNNSISINMPASIKSEYMVNLGGQGDLVRASCTYQGVLDVTGKSWQVVVKTQENIT